MQIFRGGFFTETKPEKRTLEIRRQLSHFTVYGNAGKFFQ
jgi:hypothetical protein